VLRLGHPATLGLRLSCLRDSPFSGNSPTSGMACHACALADADVHGRRSVGGTFTHSSRRYYEAEGVGQFVAADLLVVYHPGPRLEFVVECEQRVVDQIAEITGDVDAAELSVDDRQVDIMSRKVLPASLRAEAGSIDRPAARAKAISRGVRVAGMPTSGSGGWGDGDCKSGVWPTFNVTRGPVKGSETFASCRGKRGVAQPH
jgi:hypothetical protein